MLLNNSYELLRYTLLAVLVLQWFTTNQTRTSRILRDEDHFRDPLPKNRKCMIPVIIITDINSSAGERFDSESVDQRDVEALKTHLFPLFFSS
jgi:hypothetical protein